MTDRHVGKSSTGNLIRLLIQFFITFVLIIGVNGLMTFWAGNLMEELRNEMTIVYSMRADDPINAEAIKAHELTIEDIQQQLDQLMDYRLIFLIVMPSLILIYLITITVVGVRGIRKNSRELQESMQLAQKANEAKSMFLANMSHEIRTPLNAIIGFSDILKQKLVDGQDREYADVIHRSANTLLSIINDILDLSKIESGKILLEARQYDLHELLEQIIAMYKVRAEEKGLSLQTVIEKDVPRMVIGDSLRLQQVISNLMGNAIKFTPVGGNITLSVLMLQNYEERAHLEFLVKDTGIGIPKEAQERIFKPFSQADGGVSRNFGGTGLGLTISQKILQAMQTKLELESYVRQGSTFSFKLILEKDMSRRHEVPLSSDSLFICIYPKELTKKYGDDRLKNVLKQKGEVVTLNHISGEAHINLFILLGNEQVMESYHMIRLFYPRVPIIYVGELKYLKPSDKELFNYLLQLPLTEEKVFDAVEKAIGSERSTAKPVPQYEGKILVAEDNTTNRLLIQILLEKAGLTIDYAKDGYEAVEAVKVKEYDLIFMDIHMPSKDGVTATKEILLIEKDQHRLHTPIVALTANALVGDRERYIREGMDDYMPKPISETQLHHILEKYLKLNRKVVPITISRQSKEDQAPDITEQKTHRNKPYDPDEAAKSIGVDRVTMDMLLENFFFTYDSDIVNLTRAVLNGNMDSIKQNAHYMRGAAMNLCFDVGVKMLEEIEQHAEEGIVDPSELKGLEQYFSDTRQRLDIK